eukprot:4742777-Pyramimonas_sp.AAC.1
MMLRQPGPEVLRVDVRGLGRRVRGAPMSPKGNNSPAWQPGSSHGCRWWRSLSSSSGQWRPGA